MRMSLKHVILEISVKEIHNDVVETSEMIVIKQSNTVRHTCPIKMLNRLQCFPFRISTGSIMMGQFESYILFGFMVKYRSNLKAKLLKYIDNKAKVIQTIVIILTHPDFPMQRTFLISYR